MNGNRTWPPVGSVADRRYLPVAECTAQFVLGAIGSTLRFPAAASTWWRILPCRAANKRIVIQSRVGAIVGHVDTAPRASGCLPRLQPRQHQQVLDQALHAFRPGRSIRAAASEQGVFLDSKRLHVGTSFPGNPPMTVSGVRSSWETLATKSRRMVSTRSKRVMSRLISAICWLIAHRG